MNNSFQNTLHPLRLELLSYAEAVLNGQSAISVATASHIAECAQCRADVEAITRSLTLMTEAGSLEPSPGDTARLLLSAKGARKASSTRRQIRGLLRVAASLTLATACVILLIVAPNNSPKLPNHADGDTTALGAHPANESIEMAHSLKIDLLVQNRRSAPLRQAVLTDRIAPKSRWEHLQLRTMRSRDDDIAEAMKALKNNPACVRAEEIVRSERALQAVALKNLYIGRDL
jgi:hypothetical protein